MKAIAISVTWTCAAAAAIYMVVSPDGGIAYGNPLTAVSLGLIGLGLCLGARRQA